MAVSFIQMLCMASFQTFQFKIAAYDIDMQYRGLGETYLSRYLVWCVPGLLGCMSAPAPKPYFLQCLCTLA